MWKLHIYVLRPVVKTNRIFLFANIVFLSLVSLIPFASDLLGKYRTLIVSSVTFNTCLVACGLSLLFIFYVANFHRGGLRAGTETTTKYMVVSVLRIIFGPIVYSIAIGVAFHNVNASIVLSLLVPLLEVLAAFELDAYVFVWTCFSKVASLRKNKV